MLKTLWSWIYMISTIKSTLLIVAYMALHVPALKYYFDLISYHVLPWLLYFRPTAFFSIFQTYQVQAKLYIPQMYKGTFSSSTTWKVLIPVFLHSCLFFIIETSALWDYGHLFKKHSMITLCNVSFSGHSIISLHIFFFFIIFSTIWNNFFFFFAFSCLLSAYRIRMYAQW